MRKIGITMRVVEAQGYNELRDALSHDWYEFMEYAFKDTPWLMVPNMRKNVIDFVKKWSINSFILSGGNDIGAIPVRDETELAILEYALENKLPVFGVCRGLQLIHHYFGGTLLECDPKVHVSQQHTVLLSDQLRQELGSAEEYKVNSYHNFGIHSRDLSDRFQITAVTPDQWIEGIAVIEAPIRAVMWHPERDKPYREIDKRLMRHTLLNGWIK